jgi:hypothetical protein
MENSAQEASMKSMLKILGLAAFLGLGAGAAQAGGYPGDEHEFYFRQPDFNHNCFDMPWHPACRPGREHPRHEIFNEPGVHFELQFGDVRPLYREYRPRPMIQRVRFCSNASAVNKAQALGIHHIRAYAYQDYILVKGTKRGQRVEVTLSRQPGCPIIQY